MITAYLRAVVRSRRWRYVVDLVAIEDAAAEHERQRAAQWLAGRAKAYELDAHRQDYARPGDSAALRGATNDGLTAEQRRALADELRQLAIDLGGGG